MNGNTQERGRSSTRVPRRICVEHLSAAEQAIRLAIFVMPADERLTDAVVLLARAQDRVADYVDGVA